MRELDRHADLMRQGFMKGLPESRAKKDPPPQVACDWCQGWHRKGKHTRPKGAKATALEIIPTLIAEKYSRHSWGVRNPGSFTSIAEGVTEGEAWKAAVDYLTRPR